VLSIELSCEALFRLDDAGAGATLRGVTTRALSLAAGGTLLAIAFLLYYFVASPL
jgi:hypothetical protein